METQAQVDYQRIAEAIQFFRNNFKSQPTLEEVAGHVNMSLFHFQRMFQKWAGVTPKQFLQYLSVEYAKGILKNKGANLLTAASETGLSGTGRLHDLFIKVEGMTPGEYKNGGATLTINYAFADSPFGKIIVASTNKGICHMAFADEGEEKAFAFLEKMFPNANFNSSEDSIQQNALTLFSRDWSELDDIKLHLRGTAFQIKVWETLLQVPPGGLVSYTRLAQEAGFAGACRAVGTAVGRNPVAIIIPCHRVIKSTGEIGQYHWGSIRKNALIGWEASRSEFDLEKATPYTPSAER